MIEGGHDVALDHLIIFVWDQTSSRVQDYLFFYSRSFGQGRHDEVQERRSCILQYTWTARQPQ